MNIIDKLEKIEEIYNHLDDNIIVNNILNLSEINNMKNELQILNMEDINNIPKLYNIKAKLSNLNKFLEDNKANVYLIEDKIMNLTDKLKNKFVIGSIVEDNINNNLIYWHKIKSSYNNENLWSIFVKDPQTSLNKFCVPNISFTYTKTIYKSNEYRRIVGYKSDIERFELYITNDEIVYFIAQQNNNFIASFYSLYEDKYTLQIVTKDNIYIPKKTLNKIDNYKTVELNDIMLIFADVIIS